MPPITSWSAGVGFRSLIIGRAASLCPIVAATHGHGGGGTRNLGRKGKAGEPVGRTHPKSAMAMSLTLYSRPLRVSTVHIAEGAAILSDLVWWNVGCVAEK